MPIWIRNTDGALFEVSDLRVNQNAVAPSTPWAIAATSGPKTEACPIQGYASRNAALAELNKVTDAIEEGKRLYRMQG